MGLLRGCPGLRDCDGEQAGRPFAKCCSSVANLAEGEGFEPSVPFSTPLFESGTINHSDTLPRRSIACSGRGAQGLPPCARLGRVTAQQFDSMAKCALPSLVALADDGRKGCVL
jgi:hypothetical protein